MLTSLEKIHPSLPVVAMRIVVAFDIALGISQRLGVGWTFVVRGSIGYLWCACALAWSAAMPPALPGARTASTRRASVLATLSGWALFDAGLAWFQNVLAAGIATCLGFALALLLQRSRLV